MSKLVYRPSTRAALALLTIILVGAVFGLPLITLLLAAVAGQWSGLLPTQITLEHVRTAIAGDQGAGLWHSLVTALTASTLSIALGTWGALASRHSPQWLRNLVDALYLLPIAIPSVSVGLALLIAFSQPPMLLNGSVALVIITHVILVTAYAYTNAKAGLAGLPPGLEDVARSLGASPGRVLMRITLPLLAPHLMAAAALAFALSMGELGATIMLYPPSWATTPVVVFGLTDRGADFEGAANSLILLALTLLVLVMFNRKSPH